MHKGNGKNDNKIRKAWGRHIGISRSDGNDLSKAVVEYFENLMMSIISRIVEDSSENTSSHHEKKRGSGGTLSLAKAKSVINEDVSEALLVQGFDIIFKELNRYITIMNDLFKGIDWATYVKSRTHGSEKNKEVILLDEEEAISEKPEEPLKSEENKDSAAKEEPLSEEKQKQKMEEKQKERIAQQLEMIDKIYKESFLKRLLTIVEMFTCV